MLEGLLLLGVLVLGTSATIISSRLSPKKTNKPMFKPQPNTSKLTRLF